jgi:hypothetical protein
MSVYDLDDALRETLKLWSACLVGSLTAWILHVLLIQGGYLVVLPDEDEVPPGPLG